MNVMTSPAPPNSGKTERGQVTPLNTAQPYQYRQPYLDAARSGRCKDAQINQILTAWPGNES
jgi:hypothetical protein